MTRYNNQDLYKIMDDLAIPYKPLTHSPISSVAEAHALEADYPALREGAHGKALFLTNRQGQFYLLLALSDSKTDLTLLSDLLGNGRLSFASEDQCQAILGTCLHAASPFGLINDHQRCVRILLDRDMLDQPKLIFRGLRDDNSILISNANLINFTWAEGYEAEVVDMLFGAIL